MSKTAHGKPSDLITPKEFIDLFFGPQVYVDRSKIDNRIVCTVDPFFGKIEEPSSIMEELGSLKMAIEGVQSHKKKQVGENKMNKELLTLTEMLDLLVESNKLLSHSDREDELALAGRISRVIPDAAQMAIKTMAGQIRLMEQALSTTKGERQERPDDELLGGLSGAKGGARTGRTCPTS